MKGRINLNEYVDALKRCGCAKCSALLPRDEPKRKIEWARIGAAAVLLVCAVMTLLPEPEDLY